MTPQDNPQDAGASLRETGSHAAHEAPSGLRPSGFDPARVRLRTSRELIRAVEERFRKQYFDAYGGRWANYSHWERTPQQIGEALEAMNPETVTVAEVEAMMGTASGWVTERCDLCDEHAERWFEIGDEPDYEARYVNACLPCAAYIGAIAIEAQRAGTENTGPVEDESAGPQDIAQPEPSS